MYSNLTLQLDKQKIEKLIDLAIDEDLGNGDITTNSIIPDDIVIKCDFIVNESGVVAGLPIVDHIFGKFGSKICFNSIANDGDQVLPGDLLASVRGDAKLILSHERISLNFLQRLSGIATLTSKYVKQVEKFGIKIVDTRKTTPGWRYIEKYAVRVGGGENHRFGLFDQVLIKDNHLGILRQHQFQNKMDNSGLKNENGLVVKTVNSVRKQIPSNVEIEVEVEMVENVNEALESGADIVMLDNMSPDMISVALQIIKDWVGKDDKKRPIIEISGGVTFDNIEGVAQKGVDRIAIGAITHSAKALDIALEIKG